MKVIGSEYREYVDFSRSNFLPGTLDMGAQSRIITGKKSDSRPLMYPCVRSHKIAVGNKK